MMTPFRFSFAFTVTAIALAVVPACGGGDEGAGGAGGGGGDAGPAVDACEHMVGGPFIDLEASVDPSSAPDASAEHTAHRLTLPADPAGGFVGYVRYVVDEATELVFATDRDVALRIEDTGGAALGWEEECTTACTDACAAVETLRVVDVPSVGTYPVRVESDAEDVTLVVVRGVDPSHD